MAQITAAQVHERLKEVKYPGFSRNIVSFGLVKDVQVDDEGNVGVLLEHTISDEGVVERIRRDASAALQSLEGAGQVQVQVRRKDQAGSAAQGMDPHQPHGIPGISHIIAVASAKGGVGKSTVATNLALALSQKGLRTGLLDADIYGPSLPTMFGVHERPQITEERRIHPVEKDGIKLLSIGFLVPPERAMIWRGPMVMGAVQQFLGDCEWGELDVLVVDLPPGTGDAQLTLVQRVALSGVVMVTTPQEVALIDVVRGIQMFETTNAPIIGVIENMSGFVCPHCGHEEEIFGKGGGRRTSERYGVPFLGHVPIDPRVRSSGDEGRPVVLSHPDSPAAAALLSAADRVIEFLEKAAVKKSAG
jgi:ATP-binding protein involved in chromosome partitioning